MDRDLLNRHIEAGIIGWGRGERAVVIDHTSFAGDPTRPVVQATREEDDESPPPGIVHTGGDCGVHRISTTVEQGVQHIVRSALVIGSIGRARTVQLRFVGDANVRWGIDAIGYKWIPRKVR